MMLKGFISRMTDQQGALAIMFALLLPVFALLFSLAIDGSYLLQKKARLAEVVTESLVSASTHSYEDQNAGQAILERNLNLNFPDDDILAKNLSLKVSQQSNSYNYRHHATAEIQSPVFLSFHSTHGFAREQNVDYSSPVLNQNSKLQPLIKVADQTTLVDTGVGIDADGQIWIWGFRGSGQQGNGMLYVANNAPPAPVILYSDGSHLKVTKVAGGIYHLLILDENGDAWAWGYNRDGEGGAEVCGGSGQSASPCKVMSDVVDIVSGEYTSAMMTAGGEVYFLGHCGYNQCGAGTIPPKVTHPMKISFEGERAVVLGTSYEGTLVVTVNEAGAHSVWGVGDNEGCGLGVTQYNSIGTAPIAEKTAKDGSVSRCQHGVQDFMGLTATPQRIKGLNHYASHIKYIGGGQGWGAALLNDGRVIGWGTNYHLGKGWSNYQTAPHTNLDVSEPVTVFTDVKNLQIRFLGGALLTTDNKLYTFGGEEQYGIYGRTITLRATNVASFSVGKEHIYYNDMDGKLFGVGYCLGNKFLLTIAECRANPLYRETSTISWPGVELDFNRYGVNFGGQDDPTPTPVTLTH